MRKLERQPHASLSAWALILHTLRKTAFRAAAKPGTSPSGSASFSLLPFGSPQTTTPASGTSAKWLVASKPFGRLCLAPKYGKLPGHHLGVGKGCRAQAGGTSDGFTPNQGHFAGLHFGDSNHSRALLLQRCLLLLPLPPPSLPRILPRTLQGQAPAPPGLRRRCRAPLAHGRGDASLCRHRRRSAAGNEQDPAGSGGRGDPRGPSTSGPASFRSLISTSETSKQNPWAFLPKATEDCVNLLLGGLSGCMGALVFWSPGRCLLGLQSSVELPDHILRPREITGYP